MDLQIEATARALAFRHGALMVAEIVAWADSVILAEDEADPRLFDVSLAKTPAAVLSALNVFGESTEKQRVAKRVFGFFHTSLVAGRADFHRIAKALYDMADDDCFPHPEHEPAMRFYWDAFDLAAAGIAGDLESAKADLLAYLHANME